MTPRQKMYRRIWLSAALHKTEILFATKAEATSFKLKMYSWARPFRQDRMLDEDMTKARIEDMEIVMRQANQRWDSPWIITVRYAWDNPELQRIAKCAGIAFGPDADALESLERLVKNLMDKDDGIVPETTYIEATSLKAEENGMPSLQEGLGMYDDDDEDDNSR